MYSYPRYPQNNYYHTKKGQIIRKRTLNHDGPISTEQINKAYQYFIKKGILQIPQPPKIIGKFTKIYFRNTDTITQVNITEIENSNIFDIQRGHFYVLIYKPDGQESIFILFLNLLNEDTQLNLLTGVGKLINISAYNTFGLGDYNGYVKVIVEA